jgi:uncharacterized membrane protein YkgB
MSTQVGTAPGAYPARESEIGRIFEQAAQPDRFGVGLMRLGLVVARCWIGGLKFPDYEAECIVPLVTNGPLMSFSYHSLPQPVVTLSDSAKTWLAHNP